MSERPSGWYDDPENPDQLRYWDGILWSNRTMPKVKPGLDESHIAEPREMTPPRAHDQRAHDEGSGWAPSHPMEPLGVNRTPDGEPVSGWWRRVIAYFIDSFAVMAVAFVVALPWLGDWLDAFSNWFDQVNTAAKAGDATPSMPDAVANIPWQLQLIDILLFAVYEIVMTYRGGRTLGKMALGIRVRRSNSPKAPTLNQSATRFLVKQIANIVAFVPLLATAAAVFMIADYVFPLTNAARQSLHDRIASTYVVKRRR